MILTIVVCSKCLKAKVADIGFHCGQSMKVQELQVNSQQLAGEEVKVSYPDAPGIVSFGATFGDLNSKNRKYQQPYF